VVHGAGAVMKYFFELQRRADSLVRGIEGPPYIVPDDPDDTVVELLRDGLRYRVLYDRRALDLPGRPYGMVLDVSDGRRARIGDTPAKLVLTDEPAALMLLHAHPPAALVVRHPALLAALSALFELAWARAVPISVRPGTGIADAHRALLPLLVAGLTDQEIAAKLGWSHRTVRRWIRDLMSRLGAETRFQAGYEAVRRGWLEGNDDE
jgi:DNA-binding CsgD family transcriptional regulator